MIDRTELQNAIEAYLETLKDDRDAEYTLKQFARHYFAEVAAKAKRLALASAREDAKAKRLAQYLELKKEFDVPNPKPFSI